MKISDRTEAARAAYQDALQTHKGFMKGFRALSSAAKCFFSTRAVRSWQEKNMPTVARASTGQETEGSGDTTIRERSVAPLGGAGEVESGMVTPKATEEQTKSTDDEFRNNPEQIESDIATPKATEKQTESPDNEFRNNPEQVEPDIATPKATEEQTKSTESEPQLLDNTAAKSRRGAGPKNRRPPTRPRANRQ